MALQQANTTCDVYRSGNAPPAAPDVAGVALFLQGEFGRAHEAAIAASTQLRWTHIALVGPTVDVRDGYSAAGAGGVPNLVGLDTLYVPDRNGTAFFVIFVERVGRGTPGDCKRLYLQRTTISWPTDNV